MTTYFFVAASEKFLIVEEPLEEILKEYGFTEADIHELEKSNIISEN